MWTNAKYLNWLNYNKYQKLIWSVSENCCAWNLRVTEDPDIFIPFTSWHMLAAASSWWEWVYEVSFHKKLGGRGNRAADCFIHQQRNRSSQFSLLCGGLRRCATSNTTVGNEAFMTHYRSYWVEVNTVKAWQDIFLF